ncbi:VOC family protein [Microlunatus soli]|uniref:Glyoxalase/Bleomycin resistance-like N-terminal domain-containing protein n=1 Tax=Microlunatus soli TaxID=630515 RepID=A0A1H1PKV1_9ACTN|nr:VOC family protein [Microlunatus soli]SDS11766.1 hypothetical protein SAMN04489812_0934 [Microlunatus soli]
MSRMIFVNLPVADVARSTAFYAGLGFTVNPTYSDQRTSCIVVSDTIFVMVMTRDRFADFSTRPIADDSTEVINCLTCDSRQQVDDLVGRALAAGGSALREPMSDGPMYGHSFADPDGHAWEVMSMDLDVAVR